ncbi:MAG TPA: tetratricopeptide repeat protein [Dongiaceae bacterium]|nr:tetratricopeptide repeat protein [Dongiaceae bacterium]
MAIASLAMVDDSRIATALQHQQAGRLAEAERIYRAILAEQPQDGRAWHYLGMVAHLRGQHGEAAQSLERAMQLQPPDSELLAHRALVEHARGDVGRAIDLLDQALRIDPRNGEALTNLGIFAAARGDAPAALGALARAAALNPASAKAELRLANALRQFNRPAEAMDAAARALQKDPNNARVLDLLAQLRRDGGEFDNAIALHRRAIAIDPGFAGGWNNLGNTLARAGQPGEALAAYRQAIALAPDFAEAWLNLGRSLLAAGQPAEALDACQRNLARAGDSLDALCIEGDASRAQADFPGAMASYRRAIDKGLDERGAALGRLCDVMLAAGYWDELAAQQQGAIDLVQREAGQRISPFLFLRLSDDPQLQRKAAFAFSAEREKEVAALSTGFAHPRGERPRLRIGYLSADYRDHATVQLLVEVIEKHDRSAVEAIGYDIGSGDDSALRGRIIAAFDRFADLGAMPVLDAAKRIKADGVDVLVDLKGYTEGARPTILALRPAPIQLAWLGYPGTSGAAFIDYVIADGVVAPPGSDGEFSEAVLRLPRCYQPADSRLEIAAQTPSRAQEGLPENGIVFCCFNNGFKLSAGVFDIWLDLLRNCPGSVLWLLASNATLPAQLHRYAGRVGIAPDRLVFARRLDRPRHLARQRLADLFLDTAPYGAHTTASDALRVGLPVITCAGPTFASRVAASLLQHLGITELIAPDMAGYRSLALALARDATGRQAMRKRIGQCLAASSYLDAAGFAGDLEIAYRRVWDNWRAGRAPVSIALDAAS